MAEHDDIKENSKLGASRYKKHSSVHNETFIPLSITVQVNYSEYHPVRNGHARAYICAHECTRKVQQRADVGA